VPKFKLKLKKGKDWKKSYKNSSITINYENTLSVIPAKAGIQSENSGLGSPGVPEDDNICMFSDMGG